MYCHPPFVYAKSTSLPCQASCMHASEQASPQGRQIEEGSSWCVHNSVKLCLNQQRTCNCTLLIFVIVSSLIFQWRNIVFVISWMLESHHTIQKHESGYYPCCCPRPAQMSPPPALVALPTTHTRTHFCLLTFTVNLTNWRSQLSLCAIILGGVNLASLLLRIW